MYLFVEMYIKKCMQLCMRLLQLRQREWLPPNSRGVGVFEGETVYLRRDLLLLKTERQWRREHRQIKQQQQPIKTITVRRASNKHTPLNAAAPAASAAAASAAAAHAAAAAG